MAHRLIIRSSIRTPAKRLRLTENELSGKVRQDGVDTQPDNDISTTRESAHMADPFSTDYVNRFALGISIALAANVNRNETQQRRLGFSGVGG